MISIQLPNFFQNHSFNNLKRKMGIDRYTYGKFGSSHLESTKIQLETIGIEVEDLSELTPLEDHTLAYKGERVILYIRDVREVDDISKLPKFHVAHCSTLQAMIRGGRKKRYVVSQKESNIFNLNIISGNAVRKSEYPLSVCKNCLDALTWDGYVKTWTTSQKNRCVSHFEVKSFFEKYPRSLMSDGYLREDSPLNRYPSNWMLISKRYRESKRWACEECGVNLINNKDLLHTHHINGQKNDCHYSNLKALCIGCHAKQPLHEHMCSNTKTRADIKLVEDIRRSQNIV